jgi:hypothetical protein
MQRVHEADLSGHVLAQGCYEHLCLQAEYEDRGRAFYAQTFFASAGAGTRKLTPYLFSSSRCARKSRTALWTFDQSSEHAGHFVGTSTRFPEEAAPLTSPKERALNERTSSALHDWHLIESRSMSAGPRISSCENSIGYLPPFCFAVFASFSSQLLIERGLKRHHCFAAFIPRNLTTSRCPRSIGSVLSESASKWHGSYLAPASLNQNGSICPRTDAQEHLSLLHSLCAGVPPFDLKSCWPI